MPKKPDEDFNRGLAAYLQWGPARATPIEQRLAKMLPHLAKPAVARLLRAYGEIESAAHRCVIDQLETRKPEDAGRQAVADLDPRLSADNAATLYTQARISAWRDGYS